MVKLLQELLKQFKRVLLESYLSFNNSNNSTKIYPYLTFNVSGESLNANSEGFYIDVDIYDRHSNFINILTVEDELKRHFSKLTKLDKDMFIRVQYLRSTSLETNDSLLKRRNLQFYCKVDWRR